jgi:hypothetical protein
VCFVQEFCEHLFFFCLFFCGVGGIFFFGNEFFSLVFCFKGREFSAKAFGGQGMIKRQIRYKSQLTSKKRYK